MKKRIALGGWSLLGAIAAFGTVEFGAIGLALVVVAFILAPGWREAAAAFAGAAVLPLWIAYNNRGGPGTVCYAITNGSQCDERLNPWPWLGVGLALVAACLAGCVASRRGVD